LKKVFSGPGGIALLLATCIAVVVTILMLLFSGISSGALIVNFCIIFLASYVLCFIFMQSLIFKEINKLNNLLNKLRKKDLIDFKPVAIPDRNPLAKINKEIYTYALLKQREIEELKKLEAFRKEFIANVSHELKTPLFAAQGFVHTLLDGAVKDKSVRNKFLKKAAKSLDGLDMLVQDLLTLSQIETGDIKMEKENFDIVRLALEVMEQFENKAEKKKVDLKLAKNVPESIYVYADWQRINQVLINLISNAINYNKEGGSVIVGFQEAGEQVEVFVRDNGEGIPPKDVNRIFERFYRVEKSRSREKGGTGLGLAIVKHILEGHKSVVEVESVLGKGSVFKFKLPRGRKKYLSDEEEE
jgi:two-component system phosphate regulon sensor histidine kinase PhoR